jgi:hypothetical protein
MYRFLLGVFVALTPALALGQDARPWTLDLSTTFASDYMWRGFNLYDGMSIQPSLAGTYEVPSGGTFGASVWSHLSAEGNRKAEAFSEVDYTITYSHTFDPVTLTVGHAWYTFPEDNTNLTTDSNEYFFVASFDAMLNPSVSYYRDYDTFDSNYYELNLSEEVTLSALGEFTFTPFVSLGFASESEKVYADDDGLVQGTIGASWTVMMGDVSLTPSLNYTREVADVTVSEFWISTKFSYSF